MVFSKVETASFCPALQHLPILLENHNLTVTTSSSMSFAKILCCWLALASLSRIAYAQPKEISRNWTAFSQSVDASFVKKKTKFRVTASVKVVTDDTTAWAGVWARVDNKNGEIGFFDNMYDRRIQSDEWQTYTVEGEVDENSDNIYFGGFCQMNAQFYFDDFKFYVQDEDGDFKQARITNSGFEQRAIDNAIPGWREGVRSDQPVRIKEFTISASLEHTEGSVSLLLEGSGIELDTVNHIGPVDGFSPQIGTLVTMLNNLSYRVEYAIQLLDQEQTDFLLDEKANTIGALVMHLAAAEAYYQVFTFEGRGFNEEEEEKWQVALDLGEEARQQFTGHPIEYYLNIYKKVRQKTIAELKKRDDAWLEQTQSAYNINNHFCWFHVMEHQSSHLGQILMLKKRFPKKDDMADQKIDTDY